MVQMWLDWKHGRSQLDVMEMGEDEAILLDVMDQEWGNGPDRQVEE